MPSERDQTIIERYQRGNEMQFVADEFGISRQRVGQILNKYGIERRPRRTAMPADRLERAITMVNRGRLPFHAADEAGINGQAFYAYLHRRGLYQNVRQLDAWTEDEDCFVRIHYNRDLSARMIGARLGRTRNEVIGRASRLGLSQSVHLEAAE